MNELKKKRKKKEKRSYDSNCFHLVLGPFRDCKAGLKESHLYDFTRRRPYVIRSDRQKKLIPRNRKKGMRKTKFNYIRFFFFSFLFLFSSFSLKRALILKGIFFSVKTER